MLIVKSRTNCAAFDFFVAHAKSQPAFTAWLACYLAKITLQNLHFAPADKPNDQGNNCKYKQDVD
jgi:hypothetical protein